jgi:DNA polymerase III subunit epsilon
MREIILDTETTGVFPDHPEAPMRDRIVEIGCVELFNLERTGREYHVYLNPEREVPEEVVAVHGLRGDFLRDKPKFADVVAQMLEFIGDAPIVAHNAGFDANFINAELKRCGREPMGETRFVDTLMIARKRYRGASCSLDALAKRFQLDRYGFDLAARKGAGGHGALVDARILAEVYLQLKGGREQTLVFEAGDAAASGGEARTIVFLPRRQRPTPLPPRLTIEEAREHTTFVEKLGINALWRRFAS